jgi:2,3,4,5-tetrahydropyridine-2-carboxylate N-succinyltransferase
MPSYVSAYVDRRNYGRYLGDSRSCAQIGKNVHLSGGVGIGGVLDLYKPTSVIEDGA